MSDVDVLGQVYTGSIVDTVREPLLLLDADLHIVLANASFCRTFGLPADTIAGQYLYDVDDGAWNSAPLRHLLENILPSNLEMHDFEVTQADSRTGRRTMLLNARRLNHPDGQVRLILLAFEDVTERRRLEQALHATLDELARSNRDLQAFAAVASHDLQEPLRKIRAFGERLVTVCGDQLPERGRDYLARMTSAAERMQRLITDLLSLARAARALQRYQPVDLQMVVADVLTDLEETIRAHGATVQIGTLPVIEADPTQMRQLFQNLVGNALKFRGTRPQTVMVTAAARGPSHWEVVVEDNGIGFDQKHAERIFTPFERLHGRTAFEGSGIGLAICQRIVAGRGGAIRAEGISGAGTRFIVSLPVTRREERA